MNITGLTKLMPSALGQQALSVYDGYSGVRWYTQQQVDEFYETSITTTSGTSVTVKDLMEQLRGRGAVIPTQPERKAMTKETIVVKVAGESDYRFDGDTAMEKAIEHASEKAHQTNATVYILKVAKVVKPKRDVTVEDV